MGTDFEMYCPECGQKQSIKEQKFCSRCGVPLDWVAERLSDWTDDPFERAWSQPRRKYSRKEGMKLALMIFIVGNFALAPLGAVLDLDVLPPIFAVLGFGGAVSVLAYSLMFLPKDSPRLDGKQAGDLKGLSGGGNVADRFWTALGGTAGRSIHDTADRNETRPMSYVPPAGDWRDEKYPQPRSVTDSTTKLLAEEEERKKNDGQ